MLRAAKGDPLQNRVLRGGVPHTCPTRGVPHAPGCVIDATLLVVCVIGTTLARHGSCTSKDHARQASAPTLPTLRLRDPVLPSSTTLPPRGTRGLRASPEPGRVPLLILNLMRYARGMAFAKVAWGLRAYLLPSSNLFMPVYIITVA